MCLSLLRMHQFSTKLLKVELSKMTVWPSFFLPAALLTLFLCRRQSVCLFDFGNIYLKAYVWNLTPHLFGTWCSVEELILNIYGASITSGFFLKENWIFDLCIFYPHSLRTTYNLYFTKSCKFVFLENMWNLNWKKKKV